MAPLVHGEPNAFRFSSADECGIQPSKMAAIRSCFEQHGLVLLQDVISTTVLGSLVPRLEEDVLRQLLDENGRVTWTRDMKAPGHYGTLVPAHQSYSYWRRAAVRA